MKKSILATALFCGTFTLNAYAAVIEAIPNSFTEIHECNEYNACEMRYMVKNVNIDGQGKMAKVHRGGAYKVSMDILHDCNLCGNAINQIIVGLSSDSKAQSSVWNGKQKSGGEVRIVNMDSGLSSLIEDNAGEAKWVRVHFTINVPNQNGEYYLRTRYAQAYTGNLMTEEGLKYRQPFFEEPLEWWKVDRPNGPDASSNIGVIVVR